MTSSLILLMLVMAAILLATMCNGLPPYLLRHRSVRTYTNFIYVFLALQCFVRIFCLSIVTPDFTSVFVFFFFFFFFNIWVRFCKYTYNNRLILFPNVLKMRKLLAEILLNILKIHTLFESQEHEKYFKQIPDETSISFSSTSNNYLVQIFPIVVNAFTYTVLDPFSISRMKTTLSLKLGPRTQIKTFIIYCTACSDNFD